MNDHKHRGIYKNDEKINEPNQVIYRRDHLAELLKEQQKKNDSLHKSILNLRRFSTEQGNMQASQWQEVSSRLSGLQDRDLKHEKVEDHVIDQLKMLVEENKKLRMMMEKETLSEQKIIKQIEHFSLENKQLVSQINEQKDTQQEVLNRLENQEALTEKVLRQISNLRSTLFERTNFLAEKIEDSYKLTSSYMYQLVTGSDQSLTLYMPNKKKKVE